MIVCKECGQKYKPRVVGDIRCICGNTIYNSSKVKKFLQKATKNMSYFKHIRQKSADHWISLHKYAVEHKKSWDINKTQEWFSEEWEPKIPNINCSCRKHWFGHKKKLPPDFTSAQSFFKWTVDIHNVVNEMLEKPTVSYEEAQEIHGF